MVQAAPSSGSGSGGSNNAPPGSRYLQDTFDLAEEDEDDLHSNAPSIENVYGASVGSHHTYSGPPSKQGSAENGVCGPPGAGPGGGGGGAGGGEVRITMDPTERLIGEYCWFYLCLVCLYFEGYIC